MTRFPLRAKLALVALALLVLPWSGWRYVREMERFLLAAQEQALVATARAVAASASSCAASGKRSISRT